MVKESTKLRREIKKEIKKLTGKDYKEIKDIFGFSITTVNYNWDNKRTLTWKKGNNTILKWLHDRGYRKNESFKFLKDVKELSKNYNIIHSVGVCVDYWNR